MVRLSPLNSIVFPRPAACLRAHSMMLRLEPASESRSGGDWSADDFDVVLADTGETVGRIYARTSAGMGQPDWWWGLAFPQTVLRP